MDSLENNSNAIDDTSSVLSDDLDIDDDGIPNDLDEDSDGDGIPNG